jgi:prepilin-type N-terminal cleavage/methylation domain-containing protein
MGAIVLTQSATVSCLSGTEVESNWCPKGGIGTMAKDRPMEQRLTGAGFTIVEILIVLVIIGLTAAIALPNVDYAKYRVNSAMRGVGMTLMGTQRFAVSGQHDEIVMFDTVSNALRVLDDTNNNHAPDTGERFRGVSLGESIVFGRGPAPADTAVGGATVTFTKVVNGMPAVTFHRNGAASEYGGFYMTSIRALRSGSKYATDARLLIIERATGRVTWYRYDGSTWAEGF